MSLLAPVAAGRVACPEGAAQGVHCLMEQVADAQWDAGDLGCGPLVLELRLKLKAMPGKVMRVIALDPGAPEDIPAWCRITNNTLLHHDPAARAYWIRSRENWG